MFVHVVVHICVAIFYIGKCGRRHFLISLTTRTSKTCHSYNRINLEGTYHSSLSYWIEVTFQKTILGRFGLQVGPLGGLAHKNCPWDKFIHTNEFRSKEWMNLYFTSEVINVIQLFSNFPFISNVQAYSMDDHT